MSTRDEKTNPLVKPEASNERNKWKKDRASKITGPARQNQTHIPFGVGKHRKSFGHV